MYWLRGKDLNLRPLGYEPNELPGCSTPQSKYTAVERAGQTKCVAGESRLRGMWFDHSASDSRCRKWLQLAA